MRRPVDYEIIISGLQIKIFISYLAHQRLREGLRRDQIHVGVDVDSVVGEDLLCWLELQLPSQVS